MKINLGAIIYGDRGQQPINLSQIEYWQETLTDFTVIAYDFNIGEQDKLLADFKAKKIDVVIKNSYGRANEAKIEGWLELNKIPFVGSDSKATLIGTSKFLSKQIFEAVGLKTPPFFLINKFIWSERQDYCLNSIKGKINYPLVLKESGGTDSRGITFFKSEAEFLKQIDGLLSSGFDFIVEKGITAVCEITCLVAGNKLPRAYLPVEYDWLGDDPIAAQKKKDSGNGLVIYEKTNLSASILDEVKKMALIVHRALGCRDFSRADFLYDGKDLYILEVDVHPGFRFGSLTTKSLIANNENLNQFFWGLVKEVLGL